MIDKNVLPEIHYCYETWLESIAHLDDFDMIKEIQKGNKCFTEDAEPVIKAFNYNNQYISIDCECPEEQWGHPWHIFVSVKR